MLFFNGQMCNGTLFRLFEDKGRGNILVQSLTLTSVGSTQFKRVTKCVKTLHCFFRTYYPDLLPFEIETYEGWLTLILQTKMMTPKTAVEKNAEVLSFAELDPRRVIARALGSRGVYTAENAILYQRVGDK